MRSLPGQVNSFVRTNGPTRVGMPSTDAAGSGWRRPPRCTKASRGSLVVTSRSRKPNLLTQRNAFRLLDEQRVGSAVDRETVDLFAQDDAADPRRMLEDDEADAAPATARKRSQDRRCRRPPPRRRRSCGLDEIFEQRDECRRRVQRRCPPQDGRELARHLARPARRCRRGSPVWSHTKPIGTTRNFRVPEPDWSSISSSDVRADPWLGRASGALVRDRVAGRAGALGHAARGGGHGTGIRIARARSSCGAGCAP